MLWQQVHLDAVLHVCVANLAIAFNKLATKHCKLFMLCVTRTVETLILFALDEH